MNEINIQTVIYIHILSDKYISYNLYKLEHSTNIYTKTNTHACMHTNNEI